MSQRASLITGIFILVIATAYFWWRGQAKQQINRRLDLFIETVAFEKLSLRTHETRAKAGKELFGPEVELAAPSPAPSGTFSEQQMIDQLKRFHGYITFFEITETDREISIDGDYATANISGNMAVAAGPNWREDITASLIFQFQNNEEGWEISGLFVEGQ
ncbi:MAG: hypothetical protein ACON5H_00230 [Akkermansiaceae bacterium]